MIFKFFSLKELLKLETCINEIEVLKMKILNKFLIKILLAIQTT